MNKTKADTGNEKETKMVEMKTNIKKYKQIMSTAEMLLLLFFATADAFCFGLVLFTAGWHLAIAITFGLFCAGILNGCAYFGYYYGVGQHLCIPKIRKLPEIKQDLNKARNTIIIACILTIGFQATFFILRYKQIEANELVLEKYEAQIITEEFKSQPIEDQNRWMRNNRPRYHNAGNRTFDWITLIMPIVTTLASVLISGRKEQKYTRYEEMTKYYEDEIKREQNEYKAEIDQIKGKIKSLRTDIDTQVISANKLIGTIQGAVEIETINIKSTIKNHVTDKNNKDYSRAYQDLKKEVMRVAKKRSPKVYKQHIKTLEDNLTDVANMIYDELSTHGKDPTVFIDRTLRSHERKYKDSIADIEKLSPATKNIAEAFHDLADKNPDGTYNLEELRSIFIDMDDLNNEEGK